MSKIRFLFPLLILTLFITTSCTKGPPAPGQTITLEEQGITIGLSDGWEAEVEGADWTLWQRVQKGRAEEPWIIPPVTVTNVELGSVGREQRMMQWRLKGVVGEFDPTVNPESSPDTVPPGLWALDSTKLELLEQSHRILEWSGLEGVEAEARLYENTHGYADTSAIWHTYTVAFTHDGNTYEFVMSLPDTIDYRDWIEQFWSSIQSFTF